MEMARKKPCYSRVCSAVWAEYILVSSMQYDEDFD